MVKKLFKHEFLAYARVMSVVYAILFTVAVAGRAIQFLEADSIPYYIIFTTSLLTYGVCVYGVIGFTVVMAVIRFYKHLFSSEGYLSFTLPVTTTQHIIVKVVTAVCMEIITLIMVLLSGCIFSAGELLLEIFKALIYLIQKAFELAGPHTIAFAGELSVLFLLECFSGIMLYYTCICIGLYNPCLGYEALWRNEIRRVGKYDRCICGYVLWRDRYYRRSAGGCNSGRVDRWQGTEGSIACRLG